MSGPDPATVRRKSQSSLRERIARSRLPSAIRDAGTLGSGALLSQAILFLAAPLFLRLYEPADFGLYSFTYSTIALIATIVTWKTERLIVVVQAKATAIRLMVALLLIALGGTLVLFVLLLLTERLAGMLPIQPALDLRRLMWPAPVSMLVLVAMTATRLYSIRVAKFRDAAVAQAIRAVVFVAGIIGTAVIWQGMHGHGAIVMLSWQIAADACALAVQLRANRRVMRLMVLRPRVRQSFVILARHKKTVSALALSELIRSANQQLPLATVTLAFGAVPAGWYSLATAFVSVPGSVVALAVGDVVNQRLSRLHAGGRPIAHLVLRTVIGMAAVGLVPFAAISLLAPALLPVLLGHKWSDASRTVSIIAIASYLWFVTEPATNVPLIIGAKRYIILWHALRMANWISFGIAALAGLTTYTGWLWLTVAGSSLIYALESALGFFIARSADRRRGQPGVSGAVPVAVDASVR